LYPEIVDVEAGEDPLPSCSAVEALDRQEPFINQTLASSASAMLACLFRYGRLLHHGDFFNAQTGQMVALPLIRTCGPSYGDGNDEQPKRQASNDGGNLDREQSFPIQE
jgi:hypothetical protein